MKTLVLTFTDKHNNYAPLVEITKPNHEKYCARRGYDYRLEVLPCDITKNVLTPELSLERSKLVRKYITDYDVIVEIGCDVVFTNFNVGFEDIILPDNNLIMAREQKNSWPINDDVLVWVNTAPSIQLLDLIINEFPRWKYMPMIRQSWLNEFLNSNNPLKGVIRLVDARVMNSHPHSGDVNDIDPTGRWQSGDFICHCLGMHWQDKLNAAKWMATNALQ